MSACSFPTGTPTAGYFDGKAGTPDARVLAEASPYRRKVYIANYHLGFLERKFLRDGACLADVQDTYMPRYHPVLTNRGGSNG